MEIVGGVEPVEIQYFAATRRKIEFFHGKPVRNADEIDISDFDYLVIASTDDHYDEIIIHLQRCLPEYKSVQTNILRHSDFIRFIRNKIPHNEIVYTDEGLQFVCESTDMGVKKYMDITGRTFAYEEIHSFFELTDLYYGKKERTGIFLDIGANIGTTAIYAKKKMNPELRVIGFEPGTLNYKRFQANCILNDVNTIETVRTALGSSKGETAFYTPPYYPASSAIGDAPERRSNLALGYVWEETVTMTTLDDYLLSRNICAEDIDYIWIDTEGYESEVIQGAMQTLCSKRIPLFQEFNPDEYQMWDIYVRNLQHVYDNFIVVDECSQITWRTQKKVYSIAQLTEYVQTMKRKRVQYADLFFF